MSQKTYNVLLPLDHDNRRIEVGGTVDLEDDQAAPLLTLNVIADTGVAAPTGAPTDPAARLTAIKDAIATLDPNNLDLWLKDGKPDTAAIAAVTGWSVSAAERNAAWSSLQD